MDKYGDISEREYLCEACKLTCHKGHQIISVGTVDFLCHCQLTMRECQLATNCTFKYSGRSYLRQTYFRCNTCSMSWGECLCSYCLKKCHSGHSYSHAGTGSAYCDCSSKFNFCKYHTNK